MRGRIVAVAISSFAVHAGAVPAPMTDDELAKRAKLVVEAEVTGVECAGEKVDKGDFVVTEYRSELAVKKTIRGSATPTISLRGYQLEWKKEQPVGSAPATPPLAKGWRGTLYLETLPDGEFMPVWHNALKEDASASKPSALPKCGGGGCAGCAVAQPPESTWPYTLVLLLALTRWSSGGFLLGSSSRRAGGRLPRRPAR